jgi:exodeoxyribonuclease (lambda-induced)
MKQRSKEWFDARLGRFTASRISELLGVRGLGLTGENYAFEKACELVYGVDEEEDFETFDMKRGTELEPIAFRKFKELKEFEFLDVKEATFFPFGENAGSSPDGLVGEDAILEIKCPRSKKFFKLVALGAEAIDSGYYDQMQMQMMCTNSNRCYFFNYIIFKCKEMWHEIIVERDEKRIEFIKQRIIEATKLRDEFISYLTNNQQF